MEYSIVYSARKSVAITVRDGEVIVRAPRGLNKKKIDTLVLKHTSWIEKQLARTQKMRERQSALSDAEIAALKKSARVYFKDKLSYYSELMGLKYGRMSITSAKHRFGSCSNKGNICFSYRLMLYPEAARDYVVVHELAHILEMNHSARFYAIVERYMPDYKDRKKLLKGGADN